MKIKKALSGILMSAALVGCSVGGTTETTTQTVSTDLSDVKIGVVQLAKHVALDAATQGFVDTLKDELGLTDDAFDIQIAAGETDQCNSIANTFVQAEVDLIMANATPALLAAQNATASIPILGTSVTEYGTALGIEDFDGLVGSNVSGTSDLAPLDQQAQMFKELLPDAKKIGILSCSAEANSAYQVKVVTAALEALDYEVVSYQFTNTNDVQQITQSACMECDAIYIPTDNTAATCTETINNVAVQYGTPIIAGEEGIMVGCGIATLSIDYYSLGVTTGQMAARILRGEENIAEMPIEYYQNPVKKYMAERCADLNITVPDDYTAYTAE